MPKKFLPVAVVTFRVPMSTTSPSASVNGTSKIESFGNEYRMLPLAAFGFGDRSDTPGLLLGQAATAGEQYNAGKGRRKQILLPQ